MFCQKCGAKADEGVRFCLKCGNALGAAAAGSGAAQAAAPAAAANSSGGGAAAGGKKSGCGLALMIGLGVFALLAVVVIAGVVYVGYRAKKKVDEVQSALKTKDIDKMARVLGGKEKQGDDAEKSEKPFPEFKEWSPSSAGAVAGAGSAGGAAGGAAKGAGSDWGGGGPVPLRKGLTVITAIAQEGGDYQSIKQIKDMTSDSVTMEYSADNVPERPNPFGGADKNGGKKASKQSTNAKRRILREDLQNAHEYQELFGAQAPLTIPGSTAIGVSAAVLNELKSKGETSFTYQRTGLLGGLGGMLSGISAMTRGMGSAKDKEGMEQAQKDMEKLSKTECTMKRVGDKDSAFPVLLDDQSVELPAVRAKCTSEDSPDADFYILDNPDNPLALAWQIGEEDRLQVVSIRYENSDAGKQMEQQLEKKEKVKIYGIYFDFASAKIRPQSKPTLDEIAGVMKAHPDWVLRVDGHTDNVGGNASNQTLSEQRAAAVKKALVDGYHIPASHLTTGGYGVSSPADTNDTMEGRAKNRRVELSRE